MRNRSIRSHYALYLGLVLVAGCGDISSLFGGGSNKDDAGTGASSTGSKSSRTRDAGSENVEGTGNGTRSSSGRGSNTSSGTADGGTADGGTADGGTADGGTADGGTADGGTADGGTADSGMSETNDGATGQEPELGDPSDGGGSDASTDDPNGADDTGGPMMSRWEAIYSEILARRCSPCHTDSTSPAGNLDLSNSTTAYMNLVGKDAMGPACATSGLKRIVPGKPNESLLVKKLVGETGLCGSRMPKDAAPLSNQELGYIIPWIVIDAPK